MKSAGALALTLSVIALASSALAQGQAGTARATVQLPIVRQTGVSTSVLVPGSGSTRLGGNAAASRRRGENLSGVGPLQRSDAASGFDATARIGGFGAMDEVVSFRIAERRRAEGKTAEAIDRYLDFLSRSSNPRRKQVVRSRLAEMQVEGLTLYVKAKRLGDAGKTAQAAKLFEKAFDEYGALIRTVDRRREQMTLESRPEVAESTEGAKAARLLARGRRAEQAGKSAVAKIYYRTAAKFEGTRAAAAARAALDRPTVASGAGRARSIDAAEIAVATTPKHLLDLARLYRKIDASVALAYYRRALEAIPDHSALHEQARSEAIQLVASLSNDGAGRP